MSNVLGARAEIQMLARLLRRTPEQLAYLEPMAPEDLRLLREQVTEVLFTANGQALSRLAASSKVLPVRIVAAIGERAFGPLLAARITGLLDPSRAVELANTMPVEFLADVAVELDPRRASALITRIPPPRIAQITSELLRRGAYVTMGRFVGHLGDEAIRAAVSEMDDPALLRVAFVLESKDALDDLAGMLPDARLDGLIDAAAKEGLWPEALDLLSHLSEGRKQRFAAREAVYGDGVLENIVRTAAEHELWPQLLPLLSALRPEAQQRVARETERLDPATRDSIAQQARATGFGRELALLKQVR